MTAEQWNEAHPIGTLVLYYPLKDDEKKAFQTRTRSVAWALGGGHVVVSIDGHAGGVWIEHLKVVAEQERSNQEALRYSTAEHSPSAWCWACKETTVCNPMSRVFWCKTCGALTVLDDEGSDARTLSLPSREAERSGRTAP